MNAFIFKFEYVDCCGSKKNMASILEIFMLICFGISWPLNFIKSRQTHSNKGVCLPFYLLIEIGYVCGILSKIISNQINYVLVFYFLNLLTVGANIALYFIIKGRKEDHKIKVSHNLNQNKQN